MNDISMGRRGFLGALAVTGGALMSGSALAEPAAGSMTPGPNMSWQDFRKLFALRPDRIHMAGHDVPAKFVTQTQRAFEVDPGALAPQVLRGPRLGFARNIDREPVIALVDDGQAHPRAGDRCPEVDRVQVIARGDHEAQVATLLDAANGADVGDDPGEHRRELAVP